MAVCDIADRAVTFDNIYPNFKNFCQRFCSALLHIQKIRNELSSNEQKREVKNELLDEMFNEFFKSGEEDNS